MNYYFDMDGVLAKYNRAAYDGEPPLFLQKNAHYFGEIEPDQKMIEVMYRLYTMFQNTEHNLYILTSLPITSAIFNEHFHDKISWVQKWLPFIKVQNIYISVTSKRDAIEFIKGTTLDKNEILIDDYNPNLEEWRDAGGIAIKYCNGINSPDSFDGPIVHQDWDIDLICAHLTNVYEKT
jgi:5'(3')-deoxyribonucleotidase